VAYPSKLLNETEAVVLDLRPHWWFLVRRAVALVAAIALLVGLEVVDAPAWAVYASAAIVLVALVYFVGRYLQWATTNFVVTTDRLIFRTGVLAKRGIEIPLERVNTVFFSQTFLERILRSGDLAIESAGERGTQHFSDIARPSMVQNEIYRQIEDNQNRMMGGRALPTLAEQLGQLDDLRRRGVLTQEEFDRKKAQLLERM
jgi:uncharacterized membrane protein YdbT with pleckstrin-like domain